MQTVYACRGGGGSRQRQVADGADVVFTDTRVITCKKREILRDISRFFISFQRNR